MTPAGELFAGSPRRLYRHHTIHFQLGSLHKWWPSKVCTYKAHECLWKTLRRVSNCFWSSSLFHEVWNAVPTEWEVVLPENIFRWEYFSSYEEKIGFIHQNFTSTDNFTWELFSVHRYFQKISFQVHPKSFTSEQGIKIGCSSFFIVSPKLPAAVLIIICLKSSNSPNSQYLYLCSDLKGHHLWSIPKIVSCST